MTDTKILVNRPYCYVVEKIDKFGPLISLEDIETVQVEINAKPSESKPEPDLTVYNDRNEIVKTFNRELETIKFYQLSDTRFAIYETFQDGPACLDKFSVFDSAFQWVKTFALDENDTYSFLRFLFPLRGTKNQNRVVMVFRNAIRVYDLSLLEFVFDYPPKELVKKSYETYTEPNVQTTCQLTDDTLLTIGWECTCIIWNLQTFTPVKQWRGNLNIVYFDGCSQMHLMDNGYLIWSIGRDGKYGFLMWNMETNDFRHFDYGKLLDLSIWKNQITCVFQRGRCMPLLSRHTYKKGQITNEISKYSMSRFFALPDGRFVGQHAIAKTNETGNTKDGPIWCGLIDNLFDYKDGFEETEFHNNIRLKIVYQAQQDFLRWCQTLESHLMDILIKDLRYIMYDYL